VDSDLLCELLTDRVWDSVFSFDNVSDVVQCFTAVLQGLLEILVPERKFRIKQNTSPWAIGANISAARHRRDRFHHQALATGDPAIWQQFRDMRNRVNKLLKSAKYAYLSGLASLKQGQASKFWSYFHYLSHQKAGITIS